MNKPATSTNPLQSSLRSKRFRASSSRMSGREQKKRMTGEGEGKEGTNPTILKNCVRPRTQLLIGAVLVVLITWHSKHQSNQVSFVYVHHRFGFIWFVVADYKILWTDILCEGLWDQSIQGIIGDRAVKTREGQFQYWEWRRADQTGKMDCLLEITSAKPAMDKRFVSFLK